MGRVSVSRRSGKLGWLYQPPEPQRPKKSQRDETYLRVFLHGLTGAITWGWHTAADVSAWSIRKNEKGEWTLTATAKRIDAFSLRQTQPTLLFTAPKFHGGPPWCWPVQDVGYDGMTIRARLGPVEF